MAFEDRSDVEARQPTVVQRSQPFFGKVVMVPVGRATVGARDHASAIEAGEVGHGVALHRAAAATDNGDTRFSIIHAKVPQLAPAFRTHQKPAVRKGRFRSLATASVMVHERLIHQVTAAAGGASLIGVQTRGFALPASVRAREELTTKQAQICQCLQSLPRRRCSSEQSVIDQ
jgi:hypothetical protein